MPELVREHDEIAQLPGPVDGDEARHARAGPDAEGHAHLPAPRLGVDPVLGPLQGNGGPTPTLALAPYFAEVVGVDYRVSLADAVERLGPGYAVQGNLDPALLFAPWEAIERRVREIVEEGRQASGHIFNLGHGVPPNVDPDVLTRVTALVHEVSTR